MLNYRSVNDLNEVIRQNLSLIPGVDCVAGVPRSGMLPASLIALYLNKPLVSVDQIGQINSGQFTQRVLLSNNIRTVLVVDDSCDTGNALSKVRKVLDPYQKDMRFIYAAVYVTETSQRLVDVYFERVDQPRVFEWNIMDHIILSNSCVDLDGVLCEDPIQEENDDGEKYLQFLANAKPKFIPCHTIKAIVTCRLEKYRKQTEDWLHKNGIKYKQLYMMNYPDAETRRRAKKYASYKADIYNAAGAVLFVESHFLQARDIHTLTGKPVYCTGTNKLFKGEGE